MAHLVLQGTCAFKISSAELKAMVLDAGLPISSGKDINVMLDVGGSILVFHSKVPDIGALIR